MSDSIWRTLGIAQTTDLNSVDAAYERCAEALDRDQDSEGLALLRQAHEQAKQYCSHESAERRLKAFTDRFDYHTSRSERLSHEQRDRLDHMLARTAGLLAHTAQLHKQNQWLFLTEDSGLSDEDYRVELGNLMFLMLDEHNYRFRHKHDAAHHLPTFVYELCDVAYGWNRGNLDEAVIVRSRLPRHILMALSDDEAVDDDRPHHYVHILDEHHQPDLLDLDQVERIVLMTPMMYLVCLFIDSLIMAVIPFVILALMHDNDLDLAGRYILEYWAFVVLAGLALQWFTASLSRQASPAMRLFEFRVTNAQLDRASLKAGSLFHGSFALMFLTIYELLNLQMTGLTMLLGGLLFALFAQRLLRMTDYKVINLPGTAVFEHQPRKRPTTPS